MMRGYYGGWNNMMGGYGSWWMLCGLLVIILIVALFFFLLRRSSRNDDYRRNAYPPDRPGGYSPRNARVDGSMAILNERLAKGEITHEEYERIKATLAG